MKYLSTKQISELWGISPRRVALLCSQGRIAGAASTGNTWLIPEGAEKPADSRTKSSKVLTNVQVNEIYPFVICMVHSDSQLNEFTPEVKNLYRACLLHEEGDFCASRQLAEALLASHNLNVRLGAQYLLTLNCMYQSDYASADKYSALLRSEYYGISKPSPVIDLLFDEFQAEIGSVSEFIDLFPSLDISQLPLEILPYLSGLKLYSELVMFNLDGKVPDLATYEMMCRLVEADGYHYPAMLLHIILSLFYAMLKEDENESRHLKQAIEICAKYHFFQTLASLIYVASGNSEAILSQFPAELEARIRQAMDFYINATTGYAHFLRRHSVTFSLDRNDYLLISCCMRNYSIEKISDILALSRSGTNRRLAILYKKMRVSSMKEMKMVFLDSLLDWRD